MADKLPRRDDEPFHMALMEAMDAELDLLDRGPGRGEFPLEPLQVARYGAAVTGVVAYDQVFDRRANPGPPPVPLADLFACQGEVHASVVARARKASADDRQLPWKALHKEVARGFVAVHLSSPPPSDVPDVFYPWCIAEQEK